MRTFEKCIVDRNKLPFLKKALYKIVLRFHILVWIIVFNNEYDKIKDLDLQMNILMIAYEQEYHHTLLIMKQWPMKYSAKDHIDFEIYIFYKEFCKLLYILLNNYLFYIRILTILFICSNCILELYIFFILCVLLTMSNYKFTLKK